MPKESLKLALERFRSNLALLQDPTTVYEVVSHDIYKLSDFASALKQIPQGDVIWRHTAEYHTAGIFIAQGHGYNYNRNIADLIATGRDTERKFINDWHKYNNGSDWGNIPPVKSSFSSSNRQKQASYIVADRSSGTNPDSRIAGCTEPPVTHRTHLIPAQITGVENNSGLLIDYDGWLNSVPINQFEQSALMLSRKQSIVWKTDVMMNQAGLWFQTSIYDENWHLIQQGKWLDDRWKYLWWV